MTTEGMLTREGTIARVDTRSYDFVCVGSQPIFFFDCSQKMPTPLVVLRQIIVALC
jgi:hypothetical protein